MRCIPTSTRCSAVKVAPSSPPLSTPLGLLQQILGSTSLSSTRPSVVRVAPSPPSPSTPLICYSRLHYQSLEDGSQLYKYDLP